MPPKSCSPAVTVMCSHSEQALNAKPLPILRLRGISTPQSKDAWIRIRHAGARLLEPIRADHRDVRLPLWGGCKGIGAPFIAHEHLTRLVVERAMTGDRFLPVDRCALRATE